MIDKLDARIPEGTPFASELAAIAEQLRYGPVFPFRPSNRYAYTGDLREAFGIDAIVHHWFKTPRGGLIPGKSNSKIEIIDAGKKTLAEMAMIISRVYEIDPALCELMRLDLAADVSGVPVHVFRDCARFRFKQFASRIEKSLETELEFRMMGTAVAQTLYAGRRPNFIRIYNKMKELYVQWLKRKKACERFNRQLVEFDLTAEQRYFGERFCPTFEEFCLSEGFSSVAGQTITRVERQMQGARFPHGVKCFDDLHRIHTFNPFNAMQIVPSGDVRSFDHPPPDTSIRDWLAARGLCALMDDLGGAQQAYSYVQKHGKGNGKRILESLQGILPQERPPISMEEVYESFVRSVSIQQVNATIKSLY